MLRGFSLDLSAFVLIALAVISSADTYWKDPSLPVLGTKNGLSMLWFVLSRLAPAPILAGMLQMLIPQEKSCGSSPAWPFLSSRAGS